MWTPSPVNWPVQVKEAVSNKSLCLFVGNGVSRLSHAPGWPELFEREPASSALGKLGIDAHAELQKGTALPELAEILRQSDEPAWKGTLEHIQSLTTRATPNVIHRIILNLLKPQRLLTSNLDKLLEGHGYDVSYVHGNPLDPNTWILTEADYAKPENREELRSHFLATKGNALLCIGYGYSYDDHDVMDALGILSKTERARLRVFSLLSAQDHRPLLLQRLKRLGVMAVDYHLPRNPDLTVRKLALACALLDLCAAGSPPLVPTPDIEAEVREIHEKVEERARRSAVVIGLAGINRVAAVDRYPKRARESIAAAVREESGGCGCSVAKVIQACGHHPVLVSKVARDPEGERVLNDLSSRELVGGTALEFPIGLDFLDAVAPSAEDEGFRTWSSFVIEDPDYPHQRTFVDRRVLHEEMSLDDKTVDRLLTAISVRKPLIVYFDRFYRNSILRTLRQASRLLPETVWTVYESGTEGDRRFRAADGTEHPYLMEELIAQTTNVIVSSFRFSRDFLARTLGDLQDDDYTQLGGGVEQTAKEETACIARMVHDAGLQSRYFEALRVAGRKWLRRHKYRLVIVTLHEHGSLWVDPDTAGAHKLVKGQIPTSGKHTTSAGDVFRGIIVSALLEARIRNWALNEIRRPEFLNSMCELANKCGCLKVDHRTVRECLPGLRQYFLEWRAALLP